MLQRKQSLFLGLAALLCLATWLFPIATYERDGRSFILRTAGLVTQEGDPVTDVDVKMPFHLVLSVLGVALMATVFMFRNRPRQMRFVRGTYLLLLGVIAFMFITDRSVNGYLSGGEPVDAGYGFSFVMPIVALVLTFLAERAIKADEALVRSMDRLR